jgi:phage-related protein
MHRVGARVPRLKSPTSPRPDKPLAWLAGVLKTPPMSSDARVEGGVLLRRLQRGEVISMPESRPMPLIGARCHELRIDDVVLKKEWRIIYYVGRLAIAVLDVFPKDTRATPGDVIRNCKRRVAEFRKVDES